MQDDAPLKCVIDVDTFSAPPTEQFDLFRSWHESVGEAQPIKEKFEAFPAHEMVWDLGTITALRLELLGAGNCYRWRHLKKATIDNYLLSIVMDMPSEIGDFGAPNRRRRRRPVLRTTRGAMRAAPGTPVTSTSLLSAETETRRALQLDALSSILPMERRDKLAQILTDDDVATLRHLAKEGMGENSLRALASDLAYLEAWSFVATGSPLPWPAPEGLVLKFVAHHLWDPARRAEDAAHGMPADVEAALRAGDHLRSDGPHASSTVKRRLAHWATLHRWKGLESPLGTPAIRTGLRLAVRASAKPRRRKSQRAVTHDILDRLIATCQSDRLADSRDLAILLVAFASGGRRRSEVARLRLEQLSEEGDVPLDPDDPNSPRLPCLAIALGRTKTSQADDDARVLLIGPPVAALREWIERADIRKGVVFRAIDRWEAIDDRALTPQAINLILKRRCAQAGLDPVEFSAHGLRSGYLTEAARNGVALPAAMQQSQHRSVQQAASYYNDADRHRSKAARLTL